MPMTPTQTSEVSEHAPVAKAAPLRRPGAVILARHGKPALSRKCLLTAQGYGRWWAEYERLGLFPGQTAPDGLTATAEQAGTLVSSSRLRARESAALAASGREVLVEPLFIEAALPPPPFPEWIRLSPRYWGVVSRFWWHVFNHHGGQETRAQAEVRAELAATRVIEIAATGEDVLVFAHGYFNHMVGAALKARGWRLTSDQGFKYWSQRRFETV